MLVFNFVFECEKNENQQKLAHFSKDTVYKDNQRCIDFKIWLEMSFIGWLISEENNSAETEQEEKRDYSVVTKKWEAEKLDNCTQFT